MIFNLAEGRCIIGGSSDGMVKVWKLETGQMLEKMGKEAEAVRSVASKGSSPKSVVLLSR